MLAQQIGSTGIFRSQNRTQLLRHEFMPAIGHFRGGLNSRQRLAQSAYIVLQPQRIALWPSGFKPLSAAHQRIQISQRQLDLGLDHLHQLVLGLELTAGRLGHGRQWQKPASDSIQRLCRKGKRLAR